MLSKTLRFYLLSGCFGIIVLNVTRNPKQSNGKRKLVSRLGYRLLFGIMGYTWAADLL